MNPDVLVTRTQHTRNSATDTVRSVNQMRVKAFPRKNDRVRVIDNSDCLSLSRTSCPNGAIFMTDSCEHNLCWISIYLTDNNTTVLFDTERVLCVFESALSHKKIVDLY